MAKTAVAELELSRCAPKVLARPFSGDAPALTMPSAPVARAARSHLW
jgi:hypothetical protein